MTMKSRKKETIAMKKKENINEENANTSNTMTMMARKTLETWKKAQNVNAITNQKLNNDNNEVTMKSHHH